MHDTFAPELHLCESDDVQDQGVDDELRGHESCRSMLGALEFGKLYVFACHPCFASVMRARAGSIHAKEWYTAQYQVSRQFQAYGWPLPLT
jgi:hypothetical protein